MDSTGTNNKWNTAAFRKSALGPNWSHIHRGKTGDWYIRSAAKSGKVIIQDTGGNVGIGTDNPTKNLDVKASGDSEGIRLSHQDGYGPVAELIQVSGDGHLNLFTGQTKTVKRIHLSADGDSWFTPTNNGKVGIGT